MTDDARPEIQGTGKVGAIVTVFDGSKALGSTTVKADGSWSFTPSSDLSDGEYSITAKALDQTGNTAVSNEVRFTIDTVAPGKPSIDAAQDDVGDIKGEIANPGVTDDSTPTLSGKAEAGAIVTIYDNGEKLGSVIANTEGEWSYTPSTPISEAYATVEIWSLMNDSLIGTTKADADGNWSFTPSAPMAEGWDLVYAIAIDTVGKRSEASMEWEIEIEPLMALRGATSAVDDASSVQAGNLG